MPRNLTPEDRWETEFQVPVPGEPRRIGPLETLFQKLLNRTERLKERIAAIMGTSWDATPPDTLAGLAGRVSTLEANQGGATLSAHRSAATLDHPDGSVTSEKIADGAVTPAKLASGAAVANIGYIPVNRAGDTMTGTLTVPSLSGPNNADLLLNARNYGIELRIDEDNSNDNAFKITKGPGGAISLLSVDYIGLTVSGFDLKLGTSDQSTRGNTGPSRALVKDQNATLAINYAGDFTGGVRVDGPGLTVAGNLTVNGTITGNINAGAVGTAQLADGAVTASKLAPGVVPYDLALFYPGTPSAGALLAAIAIPRNLSLQGGSVRVGTAPAANWTAAIYNGGTAIGTVSVLAGQTTGTVSLNNTPTSLSAGALLRIVAPSTADTAIRDISISLQGVV
jgi:hypothetical protein